MQNRFLVPDSNSLMEWYEPEAGGTKKLAILECSDWPSTLGKVGVRVGSARKDGDRDKVGVGVGVGVV